MRRFLGFLLVCLVLALALVMGTSSRADFRVEEPLPGYHIVAADNGSFMTNTSLDVLMYNDTGAELFPGTVVVLDTGAPTCPLGQFCVKRVPAGEKEKVVGVVNVGAADDSQPQVAVAGLFVIEVTGTVAAGDLLRVSSTVAGEAEKAAAGEKGVFAIALEGGTDYQVWATFTKQEVY